MAWSWSIRFLYCKTLVEGNLNDKICGETTAAVLERDESKFRIAVHTESFSYFFVPNQALMSRNAHSRKNNKYNNFAKENTENNNYMISGHFLTNCPSSPRMKETVWSNVTDQGNSKALDERSWDREYASVQSRIYANTQFLPV